MAELTIQYSFVVSGTFIEPTKVTKKGSVLASEIVQELCNTVGIIEYIWFGLEFTLEDGNRTAYDCENPIGKNAEFLTNPSADVKIVLLYYPLTHLSVMETKVKILMMEDSMAKISTGEIYAPAESVLSLIAHHLQINNGDLENIKLEEVSKQISEAIKKYFPTDMKYSHDVDLVAWENCIKSIWSSFRGYHRFDTTESYLNLVECLPMHGIKYFEITNQKKTKCFVGIESSGLSIYAIKDKQTPLASFEWTDLCGINCNSISMEVTLSGKSSGSGVDTVMTFVLNECTMGYRIGATTRAFYNNYKSYLNDKKVSEKYKEIKKSAKLIFEKEQLEKKNEIFANLEKIKENIKSGIDQTKSVDKVGAMRVEKVVEKIISSSTKEGGAEELYEQLKNINKATNKNVTAETGKTMRKTRKVQSQNDLVYEQQIENTVTKFGTLSKLRTGNTKSRVELFEGM